MGLERVRDSEKYLYHYTEANIAIDYILKSQTLKAGNYTNTNDPKETKDWLFEVGSNKVKRDFSTYDSNELSKWISRELKDNTKLICFSLDDKMLSGNHLNDIYKRGYSKSRMWSQYANNHSGVCLVFNKNKLNNIINDYSQKDIFKFVHGPVKYVNRSIVPDLINEQQYVINLDHLENVGRKQYVDDHLHKYFERLFFEKLEDWSNESEYRYVIFSNSKEELYFNFKDALSGIIFGDSISEENILKILNLTKKMNLDYWKLKWKNCSIWYDYNLKDRIDPLSSRYFAKK